MKYDRMQRDMLIVFLEMINETSSVRTPEEEYVSNTIIPAIVDLAQDCNELEDKLEQALAVNESLRQIIRDATNDRRDWLKANSPA